MAAKTLEQIISLCKRRGFLFPSAHLYGGVQGLYDYGPLGVELKNALKAQWWHTHVYQRDDIVGLDSTILSSPLTFHYSGHEATFNDWMVDCRHCKRRFRIESNEAKQCFYCNSKELTEARPFNLMFKTPLGTISDEKHYGYLRPETAQGIFINFKNISDAYPKPLPFGIAQIGKAFRNEITPRHFIFRVREFEQMELEFFVKPGEDETWHQKWITMRYDWWIAQGLAPERLKLVEQSNQDLAHYAKATTDIQYQFPHGFEELEGIANRTDYDLGSHTKSQHELNINANVQKNLHATQKLAVLDEKSKTWTVPYVIEPSAGVDRGVLAILAEAYHVESVNRKERVVLKLKAHLAPIKVAVIPLARNHDVLMQLAKAIKHKIQSLNLGMIAFEDSGNIGKSYRRHDEIGTPYCVTLDFESVESYLPQNLEKVTLTLRERDSMHQSRLTLKELLEYLTAHIRIQ